MDFLKKVVEGFAFGLGFCLAWKILGALIAFVAGAHGGPVPS